MQPFTLTLVQTDIVRGDAPANWAQAEALIRQTPGSDLYLLPEMFSTGFAIQPEGVAETAPYPTLAWMQRMANEMDAAIAGSVSIRDHDGTYRNRFYFVTPNSSLQKDASDASLPQELPPPLGRAGGEALFYDKQHLFAFGGEDQHYTPGEETVVVEWRGVRFRLQVCFDLRFPECARYTRLHPYDALLYVANWPEARRVQWDTLLRARAIENQCYVAAVNRVGNYGEVHYNGGSCLIDNFGHTLAAPADDQPSTATARLHIRRLHYNRQQFPVLDNCQ